MMQGDEDGAAPALDPRVQARLDEQRRVVERLLAAREQIAGSVFERWSTCNKPGCGCAEGRRHGPYYVLAVGSGVGRAWTRLDAGGLEEARRLVRRHREFRKGLHRLGALHRALTDLLRKEAAEASRRAARRLGARPPAPRGRP